MGRINNCAKILAKIALSFIIITAFLMIGAGIFILIYSSFHLYDSFFITCGLIIVFFGLILFLSAYFNTIAIDLQGRRHEYWTGKKIIGTLQILTLLLLGYEIYYLSKMHNMRDTLHTIKQALEIGENPSHSFYETVPAQIFNTFFFNAAENCNGNLSWFWTWVQSNCPDGMKQQYCESCNPYVVLFCEADSYTCNNAMNSFDISCPYTICREKTIEFMDSYVLMPFVYYLLYQSGFHAILFVLCIFLMLNSYKKKAVVKVVPLADDDVRIDDEILYQTLGMQRIPHDNMSANV